VEKVIITGPCKEGPGYAAKRYSGEKIHTCNFQAVEASVTRARAEALKINILAEKKARKALEDIKNHLRYLKWAIANPKRAG